MPRVVRATRLTSGSFALGLVGASIVSEGGGRAGCQYGAVAAFVLAWEAIRFGIWKSPEDERRWLRAALVDTGKAVAVLLGVALAGGVVTQIGEAVATPPAAARPYAIAEELPSNRVADDPSTDSPHRIEEGDRP
ncbi:hypothetical protein GCM10022252_54720 [Streptosporangium oxazolinicum]|uniref:Uncharacterized protein n=1 Tax=Streptosporangium oxazolinicum TaxID=909287 RepID=A0ABP8B8N0_9ACTN